MLEIKSLSSRFDVRELTEADADEVLGLYLENPQYFLYSEAEATREQVLSDMQVAPPGIDASHKHFVGFFEGPKLIAVMDVIEGYPTANIAYLGLFMLCKHLQGKGLGTFIVHEAEEHLQTLGFHSVRLAIDANNPQSTHFWQKNGYVVIRELARNGWPICEAEHVLE